MNDGAGESSWSAGRSHGQGDASSAFTIVMDWVTAKNVAVTETEASPTGVHGPVPVQPPPLQPMKAVPAAGITIRVTPVPAGYAAKQVVPHVMPAGVLVMVPDTSPALLTAMDLVAAVNVAVTEMGALPATVQAVAPAQPPLQPVKVEPLVGVAVRVTALPGGYVAEQVLPQMIPSGVLATIPAPAPAFLTVTSKECYSGAEVAQLSSE